MAKNYSTAKSVFVQNQMKGGIDNRKANNNWCKSDERKVFEEKQYKGNVSGTDNIDRSYGSPMQDWAETSEDI